MTSGGGRRVEVPKPKVPVRRSTMLVVRGCPSSDRARAFSRGRVTGREVMELIPRAITIKSAEETPYTNQVSF